jgi:NADH-quinone oxidoreductase subunit G
VANLRTAECVVALSSYASAKDYADIILPIGVFAETSGTYVNLEGRWQSVPGAAKPVGEARPAWKVLRVLGNLLNLPDFEYLNSEQVRDELQAQVGNVKPDNTMATPLPCHAILRRQLANSRCTTAMPSCAALLPCTDA